MTRYFVIITCALFLSGYAHTEEQWVLADKIVAVIDNRAISMSELNAYIDFFRPDYPLPRGQRSDEYLREALNELINRQLAIDFFKKLFIPMYLPEILVRKKKIIQNRFSSPEEFNKTLELDGFTQLTLGEWIKDNYILLWGINHRFGKQKISSDAVNNFLVTLKKEGNPMWVNWFSKKKGNIGSQMVRDMLVSRFIREKLEDLAPDLKKQKKVKLLPLSGKVH